MIAKAPPAPTRLGQLAELARPVTMAGNRTLPVLPALAGVLPDGGLRRGTSVVIGRGPAPVSSSLAGALLAGASAAGSWCAVVGLPSVGIMAMAEMGVDLRRLALVPSPGSALANTAAALVDAVDVILVGSPGSFRQGDARRLAARVRERGSVLVCLGDGWPGQADLRITPVASQWEGLGLGHGSIGERLVEIEVSGKGSAARPRRASLLLPAADGSIRRVERGSGVGGADLDEDGQELLAVASTG